MGWAAAAGCCGKTMTAMAKTKSVEHEAARRWRRVAGRTGPADAAAAAEATQQPLHGSVLRDRGVERWVGPGWRRVEELQQAGDPGDVDADLLHPAVDVAHDEFAEA